MRSLLGVGPLQGKRIVEDLDVASTVYVFPYITVPWIQCRYSVLWCPYDVHYGAVAPGLTRALPADAVSLDTTEEATKHLGVTGHLTINSKQELQRHLAGASGSILWCDL